MSRTQRSKNWANCGVTVKPFFWTVMPEVKLWHDGPGEVKELGKLWRDRQVNERF